MWHWCVSGHLIFRNHHHSGVPGQFVGFRLPGQLWRGRSGFKVSVTGLIPRAAMYEM